MKIGRRSPFMLKLVADAVRSLPSNALERLGQYAAFKGFGLRCAGSGVRAEDVVQEVFARTLEGRRTWTERCSLVVHLKGAIRSISGKTKRSPERLAADSDLSDWPDHMQPCAKPTQESEAIQRERLRKVLDGLSKDPEALAVCQLIMADANGSKIKKTLQMSERGYRNVMKRLRRAGLRFIKEENDRHK
jgi:DNA-directed RNA polymerase specialized sigma24 family protein